MNTARRNLDEASSRESMRPHRHVLVVDQNPFRQKRVCDTLKRIGSSAEVDIDTDIVTSLKDAVQALDGRADYDVVIADIKMDSDGKELRAGKDHEGVSSRTKFVLTSGDLSEGFYSFSMRDPKTKAYSTQFCSSSNYLQGLEALIVDPTRDTSPRFQRLFLLKGTYLLSIAIVFFGMLLLPRSVDDAGKEQPRLNNDSDLYDPILRTADSNASERDLEIVKSWLKDEI